MMASRKRVKPGPYSYDDDEDYVPGAGVKYSSTDDSAPAKKKAHTLDSDEEEEEDTNPQDVLKEDEITGGQCVYMSPFKTKLIVIMVMTHAQLFEL